MNIKRFVVLGLFLVGAGIAALKPKWLNYAVACVSAGLFVEAL